MSELKNKFPANPQTYLDILEFDPKMLKSSVGIYLKNVRLLVLLLLVTIIVGIMSLISLPRTLNPAVKIPFVVVSAVLPGAGPNDVESLVTIPLEREIKRVKGIDTYSSASQDNIALISIQFNVEIDPKEARDEIQAAVNKVTDLPSDALEPTVQELDFENVPVWDFVLYKDADDNDVASLMRFSERLKDRLEDLPLVDRVAISGLDEREIQLRIKPGVMVAKDLNPFILSDAISAALKSYPAGNVRSDKVDFSLTIDQPVTSLAELRELPVTVKGVQYKLSELAEISEISKFDQAEAYVATRDIGAKRAVVFSVFKTTEARIDRTKASVETVVDETLAQAQDSFLVANITDYSKLIEDQIGDLESNFNQTLLLVFLSMLLLYGIRQALIAAMAIPLALFVVFASMNLFGFTINFLTLFSILIALGLFVDNAVVIIEAYTSYYKSGKFSPLETALLVWKDFFVELFSINLLTIWAFLPMLITTGIMGEFIKPIPIIVSIAMMGSVAVAFLFTLPAMMILSKLEIPKRVKLAFAGLTILGVLLITLAILPKSVLFIPTFLLLIVWLGLILWLRRQLFGGLKSYLRQNKLLKNLGKFLLRAFDQGFVSLAKVSALYRRLLIKLLASKTMRLKTLGLIIGFTLISYLLVPLGLVPNEFFPKTDQDELQIILELPAGTHKEITTVKGLEILEQVRQLPEARLVSLRVQSKAAEGFDVTQAQSNEALISVALVADIDRDKGSIQLAQELRDQFASFQAGEIKVVEGSSGPPAGEDIEINLNGHELAQLEIYADEIQRYLNNLPGATNVDRSVKQGVGQLVFVPEIEKLSVHELNEAQISVWLRTMASGWNLGKLSLPVGESETEYDLVLKMSDSLVDPSSLGLLQIPKGEGQSVTLNELGSLQLQPKPVLITRQDGNRAIKLTASALPGFTAPELYEQVEKYLNNELKLDSGYSWSVGGVNEQNQESTQSIINAMGISAILILVTMVTQLGSFRKAIIVMLVIPLSVSGVFLWFALTATPLSFPALIGMLSLFGIVIANSLMIVDKVNQNTEAGMKIHDSIIDASATRLEPIALTSASQIIGLIPITLSDPLWRGMGGAIIAGLSFSGILMLFFIPVVYYYLYPTENN